MFCAVVVVPFLCNAFTIFSGNVLYRSSVMLPPFFLVMFCAVVVGDVLRVVYVTRLNVSFNLTRFSTIV